MPVPTQRSLPTVRPSSALPKRFPVGARYVVEGRGGEDGHLRVISRYVVLPGGRRINVPAGPTRSRTKKIIGRSGTTRQQAN